MEKMAQTGLVKSSRGGLEKALPKTSLASLEDTMMVIQPRLWMIRLGLNRDAKEVAGEVGCRI